MSVIYVGGVKGVGKSFVLNAILPRLGGFRRVKVSENMFFILKRQGLISSYDELEIISPSIKSTARVQAFRDILESRQNEHIVFDGHYAVGSNMGYDFGIPLSVVDQIDFYVLLHNTPEVVLKRRQNDLSRQREINVEKVKMDLLVEYAFAKYYASVIGGDLKIIITNNQAQSELLNFFRLEV